MSWLDALMEQAGAVAKGVSKEVVRPGYEHILKPVSHEVLNPIYNQGIAPAMQWSGEHGMEWQGDAAYWAARLSPGNTLDYLSLEHLNPALEAVHLPGFAPIASEEEILAAHEGRLGEEGAGRGVWEVSQGYRPSWQRGLIDATNPFDPINAIGYATGAPLLKASLRGLPLLESAANQGLRSGFKVGPDVGLAQKLAFQGLRWTEVPGEAAFKIGTWPVRYPARKLIKPGADAAFNRTMAWIGRGFEEDVRSRAEGIDFNAPGHVLPAYAPMVDPTKPKVHQRAAARAEAAWNRLQESRFGLGLSREEPGPGSTGIISTSEAGARRTAAEERLAGKRWELHGEGAVTQEELDDLADVFAFDLIDEYLTTFGERLGPALFAIPGLHRVRQKGYELFGHGISDYVGTIFERAFKRADVSDVPDPSYFGESGTPGSMESVLKNEARGREFGTASDLAVGDYPIARGAASGLNVRQAGDPSSFAVPDQTAAERAATGPVEGVGELYQAGGAKVDPVTGAVSGGRLEVPTQFEEIFSGAQGGPHNLKYGREENGVWVPGKEIIRRELTQEFGREFAPEVFDELWTKITRVTYEHMVEAAQEVEIKVTAAAQKWLAGQTRQQITIEGRPTKMSAQGTGVSELTTPVKGTTIADIAKLPGGAEALTHANVKRTGSGKIMGGQEITLPDGTVLTVAENPVGQLFPNLAALIHAAQSGAGIKVHGAEAREWYDAAAKEFIALFGPGKLEDMMFFSDLVAATSPYTGPERNVALAMQAFVRFKADDPDYLDSLEIPKPLQDAFKSKADETAARLSKTHKEGIEKAIDRHEGYERIKDPETGEIKRIKTGKQKGTGKGGQKQTSYAGSFDYHVIRRSVEANMGLDKEVKEQILRGIDKVHAFMTGDRHQMRLMGMNISPSKMTYLVQHYQGRDVARYLTESTGEHWSTDEVQAAQWYFAKLSQGFSTAALNDSVHEAIRAAVAKADIDPTTINAIDDFIPHFVKQVVMGNRNAPGKMLKKRQNLIRTLILDQLVPEAQRELAPLETAGQRPSHGIRGLLDFVDPRFGETSEWIPKTTPEGEMVPKTVKRGPKKGEPILDKEGNPVYEKTKEVTRLTPEEFPGERMDEGLRRNRDATGYLVDVDSTAPLDIHSPEGLRDASAEIEKFLAEHKKTIEGVWGDQLKLGYHIDPVDGLMRLTLSVVQDQEHRAAQLAQLTGRSQIWDLAAGAPQRVAGDVVDLSKREVAGATYGGAQGRRLKQALDEFFLPEDDLAEQVSRDLTDEAGGAVGIVQQQPGLAHVVGGIDKVIDRLGHSYLAESWRGFKSNLADVQARNKPTVEMGVEDLLGPEEPLRPHENPLMSDKGRKAYREKFTQGKLVGKEIGQEIFDYRSRAERGFKALYDSGLKFAADANAATRKALLETKNPAHKEDGTWLLGELEKYGFDLDNTNQNQLTFQHIQNELAAQHGIDPKRKLSKYKVIQTAWGQQALISPRYHASNILGSWMQMVVAGHSIKDTMNLAEYWRNVKAVLRKDATEINLTSQIGATKTGEILAKHGYGTMPGEIVRTQATYGAVGVNQEHALGKVAKKIFGQKVGGALGKMVDVNAAFAGGWEVNVRGSLFSDIFDSRMMAGEAYLNNDIRKIAQNAGIDPDAILSIQKRGADGVMSVRSWRDDMVKAGLPEGQAERVVRNFLNLRNDAMDAAIKEVNRVHFSYEFTNLDEFIAKFVPFHYWASRATRFYVEESLRHPFYLYKYAQLREGMDQALDDPGHDARSKGFMKLMDGPIGFTLLMNPESLFGVAKMFDMDSSFTPDGETGLGKVVRIAKAHGVGLFPWVDATLNYMGVYGDTFAPDPAGLRTRQLVGAAVNYASASLGMQPTPAPYEASNVKLRAFISSLVDSVGPEWLGQTVAPKSSEDGTMARALLDDVIVSRIQAENPNITNQQMLDILNDPNSPEYDRAYQEAAQAGLLAQVLNFTAPTTFKVSEKTRNVSTAKINTIRDAAKEAGVRPEEYVPSMADTQFLTTYKNQTGEDFKPGAFNESKLKRDLATATPQARGFVIQSHEYDAIGSPAALKLYEQAQRIRDGSWLPPELGQAPTDPGARQLLADAWVRRNDTSGEIGKYEQARRTYRDTHPEFNEFKMWQSQMYNLSESYGPQGFAHYRDLMSQSNPNAARYFANARDDIIRRSPTATPAQIQRELDSYTVSPDAWMAATGRAGNQYEAAPLPTMGTDPGTIGVRQQEAQMAQYGPPGPEAPNWMQALAAYA